jgi:hypothetical protein
MAEILNADLPTKCEWLANIVGQPPANPCLSNEGIGRARGTSKIDRLFNEALAHGGRNVSFFLNLLLELNFSIDARNLKKTKTRYRL